MDIKNSALLCIWILSYLVEAEEFPYSANGESESIILIFSYFIWIKKITTKTLFIVHGSKHSFQSKNGMEKLFAFMTEKRLAKGDIFNLPFFNRKL